MYWYDYQPPAEGFSTILMQADRDALTYLDFMSAGGPGTPHERNRCLLPVFREAMRWLDIYFAGGMPDFTPPYVLKGSDFQLRVWRRLMDIPYGCTVTYGDIAGELASERGARMSAQAVGGAVGRNPISIIIPCHRVMGANHRVTGYGGGIGNKLGLLRLEGIDTSRFIMPKER